MTRELVSTIYNDDSVTSVALSNGSKFVAVGGLKGVVKLYNVETGEIVNK